MNVINMVELTEKMPIGTTKSRKAILWGRVDVLVQAVGQFLKANMTWDVTRVSTESGIEGLLKEIRLAHPNVVILCQERTDDDSSLPIRLIQEQLCSRVVTIELISNQIQVYSKQIGIVQGKSDLLSIIERGVFPDCTHEEEVESTEHA